MALTNNVFNAKTSNFGFGTSTNANTLANHYAPSNFNLSKAGVQTGIQTGKFSYGEATAKQPKISEWSKGAEGKWGTALAGFDSALNLTNSAMNWVNMSKQWDYMKKSMDLAEKQFNTENERYKARETERINNNNSIRGAIEGYYTNRANSSAMSADTQAAQAKAAQAQNPQNAQNNAQQGGEQAPQEPQDEERQPLPMERE